MDELQKNWELLAQTDPLYGVLSHQSKRGGKWDRAEFFATGVAQIEELKEQAERLGHPLKGGRALDFGCGVGRLTAALAAHFTEVVGLDISPAMLELARTYDASGRCRFLLNERADLALFPDGHFDLVYTSLVLQHMDPAWALSYIAEFVRVLSPGGLLVFQVPLRSEHGLLRRSLKKWVPKPLLSLYRRSRYRGTVPLDLEIEMRGIPEEKVMETLRMAGARVLEHGNGWYWVEK